MKLLNPIELKVTFTVITPEPGDLKTAHQIFVVVLPKEGLAGISLAKLPFGMTLTVKYNLLRKSGAIIKSTSYLKGGAS